MIKELPKIQIKRNILMQLTSLIGVFFEGLIVIVLVFIFAIFNSSNNFMLDYISMGLTLWGLVILIIMLGSIIRIAVSIVRLKMISYEINKQTITIKSGIIARSEKNLLFQKIQHVIIAQTFFERIFGLANVVIQTAGNDQPMMKNNAATSQSILFGQPVIPSLIKSDAEKLKEEIIANLSKYKGQGI